MRYLKTNKRKRWEELTTNLAWLGPGMRNSKRVFEYVFNEVDAEDQFIRKQKLVLRWSGVWGALCLGAGVATGCVNILVKQ
jgi:hypothetical protein